MGIQVYRVGDGPLWAVKASYFSKALINAAKSVPGMHFDKPSLSWQGYVDAAAATAARLKYEGVGVNTKDLPAADSWKTAHSTLLFSSTHLREYQVDGVRFLLSKAHEGTLLADAMRLGKSCQATVAARALKQKTLVVCPSHVMGVWGRDKHAPEGAGEIAKWWPDAWRNDGVICLEGVKPFKPISVLKLVGSKKKPSDAEKELITKATVEIETFVATIQHAQVVICHYDILYAWAEVLMRWGVNLMVLDEVHICAGYQSRRSDVLKELSRFCKYRIGLTGTPITNLPKNLHNILDILSPGRPGYFFGQYLDKEDGEVKIRPGCYANLFCDSKQVEVGKGQEAKVVWDHKGRSNLDAPDGVKAFTFEETLKARMQHIMLRRLKSDVDPELPAKQRIIIDVRVPARKMIGITPSLLGKNGKAMRECLNAAADGKIKDVVDILVNHLEEGEDGVCFCYRRLFAEQICSLVRKKVGYDYAIDFVHGELPRKERDRRIHTLRSSAVPSLLIGSIDTISTGIDLSYASYGTVAELTWEPHELVQLEERLYKFGSGEKSVIEYIIARGTGDELILRGVISKLDTFEKVIGATGDRMREDLEGKKDPAAALGRLAAAILEMQKAKEPTTKVTRKKKEVRS